MTVVASDSFTGAAGTALTAHTGEVGATWTRHTSYSTGSIVLTDVNRLRTNSTNAGCYFASGVPASADYDVEFDYTVFTLITGAQDGVVGRVSAVANTMYYVRYRPDVTAWELGKLIAGTSTVLGSFVQTPTAGHGMLQMRGTALSAWFDGVQRITATDAGISAVGSAGIRLSSSPSSTNATGMHLDNFTVTDTAVVAAGGLLTRRGQRRSIATSALYRGAGADRV